ncbi:MAG TPA: RNA polymerase sigma factor [Chitinophagaceae bacterium]|nr:RNA polymerase sigma factor [Chitinophagaceae bacterium]
MINVAPAVTTKSPDESHQAAFSRLYAAHCQHIRKAIVAMIGGLGDRDKTADDLLQETFIRIFHQLHTYNERKGTFEMWSRQIAKNRCRTYLKKCDIHHRVEQEIWERTRHNYISEQTVESKTEVSLVLSAVSSEQARLILLREYEGYSWSKLAVLLGEKATILKNRRGRIFRKIRKYSTTKNK